MKNLLSFNHFLSSSDSSSVVIIIIIIFFILILQQQQQPPALSQSVSRWHAACVAAVSPLSADSGIRCVVWFVVADTDLISQPYGLIFCLINSPQHNAVKAHLDGKGQTQTASVLLAHSLFGCFSLNNTKQQCEELTASPTGCSDHCSHNMTQEATHWWFMCSQSDRWWSCSKDHSHSNLTEAQDSWKTTASKKAELRIIVVPDGSVYTTKTLNQSYGRFPQRGEDQWWSHRKSINFKTTILEFFHINIFFLKQYKNHVVWIIFDVLGLGGCRGVLSFTLGYLFLLVSAVMFECRVQTR